MHIALDGSDLASTKLDGTTVYVRELLPRLVFELNRRGHRVTVFSHTPIESQIFDEKAEIIITRGRRFWTQTVLSRALFRMRPDLLFLPIQSVPLYRPANLKVVATIHDLDFMQFPTMFGWKNLFLLRWFSRVVTRNATRLIAVTENTKKNIVKYYSRVAADIAVVYHGYDETLFYKPISPDEKNRAVSDIQKKYGLSARPILYVGAIQPRKNIVRLVEAFEQFKKAGGAESLVLVTGNAWREKTILRRIADSPQRDAIHILRRVPYGDLAALYWNASVMVLPSLAEGFGLPILEAMACGVPVITSNVSATAEVAGDAAILVNPENSAAIASDISRVLSDSRLAEKMTEQGLRRVKSFSWVKCAKETADVIEQAL